ncbi:bifunctional metallophosphatase/5'-nucleotidase [Paenibacillus glucanolyticus]|uniref:Bifunctional metallophosphatase/5'-nucleotidase n=3 Tax=Paenibacillaceae TaxID=186822 RepID=A0A7Z2VSW6_9BACL|nr:MULTISPECIES: bifunctional metallophosphatase/5'-nucleotidase [Paenibacillaceae]MCK8487453.1 bifunctional metallophosphatase/5'-nucleotidase [Paenibacillus mellifer]MCT1400900.1 bifunctional metallophosphatase/5'-nucleotidase [Paenibacillus sp. p3-SID867]QJD88574.1 bifunctional metallophosphatase/5'-nucleotidase [Cohnella herbarum]
MELTIIQQNDTHGCLDAHPEFFWHDTQPSYMTCGGFSRIHRYVTELKKRRPHVLFVDGGDLFHGTAPLVLSKGEAIIPLLKMMPLDAFVPGNWDYAYGPSQLFALLDQVSFPALAMNMKSSSAAAPLKTQWIKEMGGIRIGMTGWTYSFVDQTMPPAFSEGLSFSLDLAEMSRNIRKLRVEDKCDLVIVLSHMGLPLDVKAASNIEGIDIILSGHSHDRLTHPIRQNGTWIIQSGASSSFLGQFELNFESGMITKVQHRLIPLFAHEFEEDPEISKLIVEINERHETHLSEIIGELQTPLHRMFLNETPMDRLITDAYLHSVEADIALSHGWRYGAPILPGLVTLRDLYQIIPTNPELFTVELDGKQILEAFESNLEQVFSPDPFHQKGGYVMRASGITMAYKPYNPPGHRIEHFLIQGKPLKLGTTYRIVSAGEQILYHYDPLKKKLGIHAHDVITQYFKSYKKIEISDTPKIFCI